MTVTLGDEQGKVHERFVGYCPSGPCCNLELHTVHCINMEFYGVSFYSFQAGDSSVTLM